MRAARADTQICNQSRGDFALMVANPSLAGVAPQAPEIAGPLGSLRVGVVGGGVLGMYLSWRLQSLGARVELFEAAPETGGLASPERIGEYDWDRFYHVMLLSDQHLMALISELGLEDKLNWGITQTGFFTDGDLVSMSNALEFLRFPPLGLLEKIRLGGTIFYASRISDWQALEEVLAVDWLTKFSGRRVVEKIWLPLLKSKLGENYKIASASFIWAIIARMYAARRAGLKREMFGYVDGGYRTILGRLQQEIDSSGVETHYGARVEAVTRQGEASVVSWNAQRSEFDAVVMTVPTGTIAQLCPDLEESEKSRLQGVTYQGIICPSFVIEKSLSPYYVTNITDSGIPFTGVIEMTALVDKKNFGGNALVYLPQYLTQEDPYWDNDDGRIYEDCLSGLEKMYPHFNRDQVVAKGIARARKVLAVSTLNYSTDRLPSMETSLNGVFVLNSAQIANGTLNVNETLGVVNDRLPALEAALRPLRQMAA